MIVEQALQAKDMDVVTVGAKERVIDVARRFEQKRKGLIMVCGEDGRLEGVVSLGDVVHAIGEHGSQALEMPVDRIMSENVAVCEPGDDIDSALGKMAELGIRHLPVVKHGKPLALIEQTRALEAMYEDAALDFAQLKSYVFRRGGSL